MCFNCWCTEAILQRNKGNNIASAVKKESMKANNNITLVEINENEMRELTKEVKETIATGIDIDLNEKPMFSAADLWNIQRTRRIRQGRRMNF
jgi:hypothetical protein